LGVWDIHVCSFLDWKKGSDNLAVVEVELRSQMV